MREVEFRAWNGDEKKMYYQDNFHWFAISGQGAWLMWEGIDNNKRKIIAGCGKDEDAIMQFTTLRDKNGKKIYGEDLIRTYINLIFIVKFTMGAFWIEWISKSESEDTALQLLSAKNISYVVIGNRYENPELLEAVK